MHSTYLSINTCEIVRTNNGKLRTVNFPHGKYGDGLDGRYCPREQMKVLRIGLDSLVTPLQACRQEPSQRQHYPPDTGRHAEEVQHHEQYGAELVLRALKQKAFAKQHTKDWTRISVHHVGRHFKKRSVRVLYTPTFEESKLTIATCAREAISSIIC